MTEAADFFNAAITAAPSDPQRSYKLLLSSVYADPALGVAWHNLACVQADNKMLHAAVNCWRRALQTKLSAAHRIFALTNIGHRLFAIGRLDEAWDFTQQAIAADPNRAYPWENLSAICIQRGDTAKAVEYARKGYAISQEPVTEVQLALSLLNDGQFAEGLKHFEARFPYGLKDFTNYPYPRWDGSEVSRLFVCCEQGLGDTLSFCRFVPWAARRVGEVILAVPPELARLLEPALPSNVSIETHDPKGPFPAADAFCPVMSLPTALGMDDRHIADCPDLGYGYEMAMRRPRARGAPLRIGVSWAGSVANAKDQFRSLILEQMMDLFSIPGTEWLSLQADGRAEDLHRTGAIALVRDMAPMLKDAAMTADVLAGDVDLVLTIDSFLGHLCGSVGRECWVMAAMNAGDFRLGRHGDKPALWYRETHRVFRQGSDAQWGPVISDVAAAIKEMVG